MSNQIFFNYLSWKNQVLLVMDNYDFTLNWKMQSNKLAPKLLIIYKM